MGDVTVSGNTNLGLDLTAELAINRLNVNLVEVGFTRLDWNTAFSFGLVDPGSDLPTPSPLPIDFDSGLELLLSGTLSGTGIDNEFLNIAGVSLSGSVSFSLTLSTVDLDIGGTLYDDVELTTFALGINSPLSLKVDAIKASITSGSLAVATINRGDGTEYFGLRASGLAATVTGVAGLDGALEGVSIRINKATDAADNPVTLRDCVDADLYDIWLSTPDACI